MRYLILSDLHGNWEAFAAVLHHVRRKRFDVRLVLGDLVGYGAAPNQVVEAVRELPSPVYMVRGNHDKVVIGAHDGGEFNAAALAAARWTAERLEPANRRFVAELARGPIAVPDGPVICHGSPLDEDQYLLSPLDAWEVFASHPLPLTFFGHTHLPTVFASGSRGIQGSLLRGGGGSLTLDPELSYLVNPGAVGQPRDRDPRAAYMTYDSDKRRLRWYRVAYPVERAQRRILEAGLPRSLAERLAHGI